MLEFIPEYLHAEYSVFQVAQLLGVSLERAGWLDAAQINRLLSFRRAADLATVAQKEKG